MRLALAAESNEGMRVVTNFDDGGVLVGTTGLLHGPFSPVDNTPCLDLDLNEKLGIRGDIHPETHAGHSLITSWLEANPSPPINDSAPRSVPVTRSRR